jgi:hypothetical protein
MIYLESDTHGADEWCMVVDAVNDVFNYQLGFVAAQALSSVIPHSKVIEFPWPQDIPKATPNPAQVYACVWLPLEGEQSPGERSQFLCFSGVCIAQEWLSQEGFTLSQAAVADDCAPLTPAEESLRRMMLRLAQSLPWMPELPGVEPLGCSVHDMEAIVKLFAGVLKNDGKDAKGSWDHLPAWQSMENEVRVFAAPRQALALNENTQPPARLRSAHRL